MRTLALVWPALLVVSVALSQEAPDTWNLRYSAYPNLTDAQRAAGGTPDFVFTDQVIDGVRQLSLEDSPGGERIGQVYLGRRLTLTTPLPRNVQVSLEFQAACAMADRAPTLRVMLLTDDGWNQLATDPATAGAAPRFNRQQKPLDQVIPYDIAPVEWRSWNTGNLALNLRGATPAQLWLVLVFDAKHLGSVEYAHFRQVEVTMGQTVPPPPSRTPRGPLKTSRALLTDDELALARQRLADEPAAAAVRDTIVGRAQPLLDLPLDDAISRMPGGDVPRAFNDSVGGCPVHGKAIFEHGTYPWILNFDQPFKVECPIGHETYPSNDFMAWRKSGYTDQSTLTGDYVDDGWGWVNPQTGERHWLVAYANHWYWRNYMINGLANLGQAWVLTGDRRYADRCAALLAYIADIYPGFDYDSQSRYGTLTSSYQGKLHNHIWETGIASLLATAYDQVWETIDTNTELLAAREMTGEQLRAHLEANLLEEAIDSVLNGKIEGNFGMHQRSLATLVAVRQPENAAALLGEILDKTGAEGRYEGIRYALHNSVHRDGVPYETSPGYNFSWVANLADTADLIERAGVDLYADPQFRRLFDWPLALLVNNQTPAIGDSGSITPGRIGPTSRAYRAAFRRYGSGPYAWAVAQTGIADRAFGTFDSLFEPELAETVAAAQAAAPYEPPASRALDGYGMVLLNNANDSLGVSHYYGYRGGHSHHDGLTFDLFAHGTAATPDTGYPDFMNSFVPGIYTWSKITIAHNTVTVDAQRQTGNQGGTLEHFAHQGPVQFSDVSAPGNYPNVTDYRRALALVSLGDDTGYLLDVFRVAGGSQHDYSLHGTVGEAKVITGQFGAVQTRGTLAGEEVAVGQIYDDATLGAEGYTGGFGGYRGSGFQHLINVRRQEGTGAVTVEVTPTITPAVNLRLHLTAQPGQQAILAQAQVSPVKDKRLLPYLLARRTGDDGLRSTFATILEPYAETPAVETVDRLANQDEAVVLQVTHALGTDLIVQQPTPGTVRAVADRLSTDGALTILRHGPDGVAEWVWSTGATTLTVAGQPVTIPRPVEGRVTAVDLANSTVTIDWNGPTPAPGDTLQIGEQRLSPHTITAAQAAGEGQQVTLQASLISGLARLTAVDDEARTLQTDTRLLFQPLYAGQYVVPEQGQDWLPIERCQRGQFTIGGTAPVDALFTDADQDGTRRFTIAITAPGDPVRWTPASLVTLKP